jgi:uncharacterized membrane protein YbhN (UPF0104 family)
VEDGSRESTSDIRLPPDKVRAGSAPRQAGRRTRLTLITMRLLVGVGMLVFIFSRIDLSQASLRPSFPVVVSVCIATGLWLLSQAVAAFRWRLILGDNTLTWSYLLRLYIIGSFFGLFLPASVGGDAVRALAAVRSSDRAGRAIASVLIDRGFGVVAVIAYACLGLILAPASAAALGGDAVNWHVPVLAVIGLGVLAACVALLLRRTPRMRSVWHDGRATLGDLARSPSRLRRVCALAILSQGLVILLWYTLAQGMNFQLPVSTFLWAVPLVSLGALLPITFAGLGVREGIWLILLAHTGIPPAQIVSFSLLYFACNILVGITGGILFVSSGTSVAPATRVRA